MPENDGSSDGLSATCSSEQLAVELGSLLRPGASLRGISSCPSLLALSIVRAKSATSAQDDLMVAAYGLLRELVVRADGAANGPIATLLGLASGMRGALLKDRRRVAGELLAISPSHLRTSGLEIGLCAVLADEVFAADSAFRLRQRHRSQPDRLPGETRLGIDWLDRHQAYRRVWTPVAALRDDLAILLQMLQQETSEAAVCDRLVTMTWRYAQYCTELEAFIRDYGGLWVLGDVQREFAAADAIRRISTGVPFGDADNSWLRLLLGGVALAELEPFADGLSSDERGEVVLGTWLAWARSRECVRHGGDRPVHRWQAAVAELTGLLDADWLGVADWYRLDPSGADHLRERPSRENDL